MVLMVSAELRAIEQAARGLLRCGEVCCLTGAGISAESGVPTFRGQGGFWQGQRSEDLATPQAFARDPQRVWAFYNYRRRMLLDCAPNAGHGALVQLEKLWPGLTIVTQNVDGLHQASGSRRVIELHGSIWTVRCTSCAAEWTGHRDLLGDEPRCALCAARLRPGVVWFGEELPMPMWMAAEDVVTKCGALLVVGTSAVVQPAGSLVLIAKSAGAMVIEVNVDESAISQAADAVLRGPAGVVLPELAQTLAALSGNP
jgi:NAD-dependent deacetylase